MSRITHLNEACHAYGWVMSRMWKNFVTYVREACHAYEWAISHTNKSCRTYEWVTSHIWVSCNAHMSKSRPTCERIMSCTWMSRVEHGSESCRIRISHDAHVRESRRTYEWIGQSDGESAQKKKTLQINVADQFMLRHNVTLYMLWINARCDSESVYVAM